MKKRVLSIVSFILIFVLLFILFQGMFKQTWEGRYVITKDIKSLTDEDCDVLVFGTSDTQTDYDAIVTYNEQGITGYNLAVPFESAITAYYQLCQALEYHTPKIVVCDFVALFEDGLPKDDATVERLFCETFDILEDPKLKLELVRDLCRLDETKTPVEWLFPLVRYHSMWNSLGKDNFELDYKVEPYRKGARLCSTYYVGQIYRTSPEDWEYEEEKTEEDFSEISVKYYDMFIEKCQEKGITVVAVIPPNYYKRSEYASRLNAIAKYCYSRGAYCLNYNTYDEYVRMDLDLERDYYDDRHLNTLGSVKYSKALADDLRTYFDIPDRRTESGVATKWDADYKQFEVDMLNSQETLRSTVNLATELGYNAIIQVASDKDEVSASELIALNNDYGYVEGLKTGYYLYSLDDTESDDNGVMGKRIDYYPYDRENDEETIETSMGTLERKFNLDEDYKYHIFMNENELFSEQKVYYQYEINYPKFATKVTIVDKDMNVIARSSWEYDNRNGNSSLLRRGE